MTAVHIRIVQRAGADISKITPEPTEEAMSVYSYRLDRSELDRYRAMAQAAQETERELWGQALRSGADVVDLGCGPGTFLPTLSYLVATGSVTGVDASAEAVAGAQQVIETSGLRNATVELGQADDTGFPDSGADVVFVRNLLVHNGPRNSAILAHARGLLRPGGRLLCAEPDIGGIDFGSFRADAALESRWIEMAVLDGNDPTLGKGTRLDQLLSGNGFRVLARCSHRDELVIDRSPAWTASERMLRRAVVTEPELTQLHHEIERRLRDLGPLRCTLPMTAVLAEPVTGHRVA